MDQSWRDIRIDNKQPVTVMNVLHEWSLFWHYPSKIVARSPLTRWLFCHLNCDPDGSNQKIYSFVKSDKCSVEILLWISKWYFDKRGHKGWSYLLASRRIKCNSSNNKSQWRQRLSEDNPKSKTEIRLLKHLYLFPGYLTFICLFRDPLVWEVSAPFWVNNDILCRRYALVTSDHLSHGWQQKDIFYGYIYFSSKKMNMNEKGNYW